MAEALLSLKSQIKLTDVKLMKEEEKSELYEKELHEAEDYVIVEKNCRLDEVDQELVRVQSNLKENDKLLAEKPAEIGEKELVNSLLKREAVQKAEAEVICKGVLLEEIVCQLGAASENESVWNANVEKLRADYSGGMCSGSRHRSIGKKSSRFR